MLYFVRSTYYERSTYFDLRLVRDLYMAIKMAAADVRIKKPLTRNIKGEGVQDKLDVKNTRTATDRRQQYDSKILSTNDNQYDEFNP